MTATAIYRKALSGRCIDIKMELISYRARRGGKTVTLYRWDSVTERGRGPNLKGGYPSVAYAVRAISRDCRFSEIAA